MIIRKNNIFKFLSIVRQTKLLALIICPVIVSAAYFGNPAQSVLQTNGLVQTPTWYCVRLGFMSDSIYRQRFNEEFHIVGTRSPSSYATFLTNAGTITIDIKNRFDINALLGSTRMQIDHEVDTKHQFAWGLGGKLLIYQTNSIFVGLDVKYFQSNQLPTYLLSSGHAYNILSDFKMKYIEEQASLGIAYRINMFVPYICASYVYSKIEPIPSSVIVRIPTYDGIGVSSSTSVINKRRWGMAFGATVVGNKTGSITIESRFFNQNAINISGEIRF